MHNKTDGLRVERLSKVIGGRLLWKDLTFEVRPGSMLALTGPSGSGKSSLLNCIGLLDKPSEGAILMGGVQVTSIPGWRQRRIFRKKLGFLFQNFGLVGNWTIRQNLDVALQYSSLGPSSRRLARREALQAVGVEASENHRVYTLSGGEQQRVAFARLLIKEPEIVLADEPTAALDRGNGRLITDLLERMCDRGASVVVTTHDERVAALADDVIELSHR